MCGGARAGCGGAREHEIGLDPRCQTPDPELHRLSRWAESLGGSVPGIAGEAVSSDLCWAASLTSVSE